MSGEHSALIAPLGAAGRAEEIIIRISEAIQLGLLSDGERLPAEADFAQQFGVSPVTLREAIATLRERGLIETRGVGPAVRSYAGSPSRTRLRTFSASVVCPQPRCETCPMSMWPSLGTPPNWLPSEPARRMSAGSSAWPTNWLAPAHEASA